MPVEYLVDASALYALAALPSLDSFHNGLFIHWVLYIVGPNLTELPQGVPPDR